MVLRKEEQRNQAGDDLLGGRMGDAVEQQWLWLGGTKKHSTRRDEDGGRKGENVCVSHSLSRKRPK